MRYWDSSALVALLVQEKRSPEVIAAMDEDPFVLTSTYTAIEIASALWRRRHTGELTPEEHLTVDRLLADLSQTWLELPVSQQVINAAIRVLAPHRLRAGDALQLGTAVEAARSQRDLTFVTLDDDLASAARTEGFPVLP
ncbi:MAG TPA: type II toxin-antitoxin system VapC family toxin [Thermoanaerobaculia bacterium]|nr:type II toxin-antitoxin system VapC family toxin [Thermoanaerobaculia bacterium]